MALSLVMAEVLPLTVRQEKARHLWSISPPARLRLRRPTFFTTLPPQRQQRMGMGKERSVAPLILVIDDEEPVRTVLRQMLEKEGYNVEEAADGAVGLSLLQDHPIDLIITDLFMPEKEGIETMREVRRSFPQVKIIAMS